MARFSVGDLVRVPQFHPQAPSLLWGQVGTVSLVGPPMSWVGEKDSGEPVEQQYKVTFDGLQVERAIWEGWLEPLSTDAA